MTPPSADGFSNNWEWEVRVREEGGNVLLRAYCPSLWQWKVGFFPKEIVEIFLVIKLLNQVWWLTHNTYPTLVLEEMS
jgi:hypothetical protein